LNGNATLTPIWLGQDVRTTATPTFAGATISSTGRIYFFDTNASIFGSSSGVLDLVASSEVRICQTTADTDVTVRFVGTTHEGVLNWFEDEDYFRFYDDIFMADGENILADTTTGTKFGGSDTAKISVYNATPVIRANHIVDADGSLADCTAKLNAVLVALENFGIVKAA